MTLKTGTYRQEEFLERIREQVDKNKWHSMLMVFRVMDDDSIAVDTLEVRPVKEEISDEEWLEGHRKWQEAQKDLKKIYG